ncbi:uncharacterized protein SPSK_02053 [Sporothrix schenckii 1099-18]|uniref:Uncharacterized protein n=1 Tax=Sporothrix schenckii 1099-18 TaxID=1397361 RepID=A0A0F2MEK5_SPOSC|nr:uncharacterized protein SPSK_02053 [Sporothrix schenckii 1099-18]KJR87504.1 hypothetical protein SPSK_02053 [Sporothrix schenckii 1099-18]
MTLTRIVKAESGPQTTGAVSSHWKTDVFASRKNLACAWTSSALSIHAIHTLYAKLENDYPKKEEPPDDHLVGTVQHSVVDVAFARVLWRWTNGLVLFCHTKSAVASKRTRKRSPCNA